MVWQVLSKPQTIIPLLSSTWSSAIWPRSLGSHQKWSHSSEGVRMKGMGTSYLSLVLLVNRKSLGRSAWILKAKKCLCSWCQQQSFNFHVHGTFFQNWQLLRIEGSTWSSRKEKYLCKHAGQPQEESIKLETRREEESGNNLMRKQRTRLTSKAWVLI